MKTYRLLATAVLLVNAAPSFAGSPFTTRYSDSDQIGKQTASQEAKVLLYFPIPSSEHNLLNSWDSQRPCLLDTTCFCNANVIFLSLPSVQRCDLAITRGPADSIKLPKIGLTIGAMNKAIQRGR